jgi:hypothetical protein
MKTYHNRNSTISRHSQSGRKPACLLKPAPRAWRWHVNVEAVWCGGYKRERVPSFLVEF